MLSQRIYDNIDMDNAIVGSANARSLTKTMY
jgi:hypothetical protein